MLRRDLLWLRGLVYASVSCSKSGRGQCLGVERGHMAHVGQKEDWTRHYIEYTVKDHLGRGGDGVATLGETPTDGIQQPDERDVRGTGKVARTESVVSEPKEVDMTEELIPKVGISE